MSPLYLVAAGGAILYLLSKKAEAAAPPPAPPPALPPGIPSEVIPEEIPAGPEEPSEPPVGSKMLLAFPVQTRGGTVVYFEKDARSWNGRKGTGAVVIGTSFSTLGALDADGRFEIASFIPPHGV